MAETYIRTGRARFIKPEFFIHEGLYDLERQHNLPLRLAFAGLWTQCDREGRFKWRPRSLKLAILPYDEVDFGRVLDALTGGGLIVPYEIAGERYGFIPTWKRHQYINNREQVSQIPEPTDEAIRAADTQGSFDSWLTREGRVPDGAPSRATGVADASDTRLVQVQGEGKGREGKGSENTVGRTPVLTLPLNDGSEYPITQDQVSEWAKLYRAVNVGDELRAMRGWLLANSARRKTKSGILRFVANWLKREQDKPHPAMRDGMGSNPGPEMVNVAPPVPRQQVAPADDPWAKIQNILKNKLNRQSFDTWLRPAKFHAQVNGTIYVAVPSFEFVNMGEKYGEQIAAAATALGVQSKVQFFAAMVPKQQ